MLHKNFKVGDIGYYGKMRVMVTKIMDMPGGYLKLEINKSKIINWFELNIDGRRNK